MNFHIISLFPNSFDSYFNESILKKAIESKKIKVSFYNPMDFIELNKKGRPKRRVDDKPYGGGPGMVIRAEPILACLKKAIGRKKNYKIIYFSPRSKKFDTDFAKKIAKQNKDKKLQHLIFVCGRYEGIDSRVEKVYKGDSVSIGDYVLTGGELPTMVMIDSISRQIDGVLGDKNSLEEDRISAGEYYTRPEEFKHAGKTYKVPKVLLSGNHKDIDEWRESKK